jgi:hypothetical protein
MTFSETKKQVSLTAIHKTNSVHFLAHLYDVLVGERLMWLIVFSVLQENLVHICASILVQLVGAAEYN